ncbi:axonemal dynein light chain domain-containing protein 1-like [Histomonas meleagridis]|uniref:axonemal dynein light chain domain-containing protein 1-like n=1 Tax=Histomonas meleagridis TaxID=135588 RepID=UPI00355A7748|nr:axonemal dynein light chain domain-containing protein 1-like [Histomonas meleagridis]KAH0805274.1 axonemal dynein light chain domain-containing protein 1-like [Histomonas meleagridis]
MEGEKEKQNISDAQKTNTSSPPIKRNKYKTTDLSHVHDHKTTNPGASFIPNEFIQQIQTPTPLKPGASTLMKDGKTWTTTVFPSENVNSISEIENLEKWLNKMLEENQKNTEDIDEFAYNAKHWYTIAFNELCRQVSVECPERARLLLSIWKRYQSLTQRVMQLHQEEKNYLIKSHKERTASVKSELENYQSQLKIITQQYHDEQENRSNAREQEEIKFANMRRRLDLQIRNKHSLMLQIKTLQNKLNVQDEPPRNDPPQQNSKPKETEEPTFDKEKLLDHAQQVRQKVRQKYERLPNTFFMCDDIVRFIDQESKPTKAIKGMFPAFFGNLSSSFVGQEMSTEWATNALTYIYSHRIIKLCSSTTPLRHSPDRHHFLSFIYNLFLTIYNTPEIASKTLFNLILTSRTLSATGNLRFTLFLRFINAEQPYLDAVNLDFYCFCLASFSSSNPNSNQLFWDDFSQDSPLFSPVNQELANTFVKKVLNLICYDEIAQKYCEEIIGGIEFKEETVISVDQLLNSLLDVFSDEENRNKEQIHENYEMDTAQYGGIVTFGQFQTLSMFLSSRFDQKYFVQIMRETLTNSSSKFVSFNAFINAMHINSMLVPFSFEKIGYNQSLHSEDLLGFIKQELILHEKEFNDCVERAKNADQLLSKKMRDAITRLKQLIEAKRAGYSIEAAHREIYELIAQYNCL